MYHYSGFRGREVISNLRFEVQRPRDWIRRHFWREKT